MTETTSIPKRTFSPVRILSFLPSLSSITRNHILNTTLHCTPAGHLEPPIVCWVLLGTHCMLRLRYKYKPTRSNRTKLCHTLPCPGS